MKREKAFMPSLFTIIGIYSLLSLLFVSELLVSELFVSFVSFVSVLLLSDLLSRATSPDGDR